MARFRGDVHAGSERVAATFLVLALLIVIGLVAWWIADPMALTHLEANLSSLTRRP